MRHHVMLTVQWNTVFIECTCGWSANMYEPLIDTIADLFVLGRIHVMQGQANAELN